HPGKTAQLFDRPRHTADNVLQIELNHFRSRPGPGVFYVDANLDGICATDLPSSQMQVGVAEFGVAQPVTEGIERCGLQIDVRMAPATLYPILLRSFGIVINRQLSGVPRYRDRQSSAWVDIAK